MIIRNLVIGIDKYGHKLMCGDVCTITCEEGNFTGMITYDDRDFCFVFQLLDENSKAIPMHSVTDNTIVKLFEPCDDNFQYMPEGVRWKEIYLKHCSI